MARPLHVRTRRPDRATTELALRAAIGAGFALWFGTLIGLEDPYWGAISAVVATAGTLGASLGAAFQRVTATTIALAIGLGFAALPRNGVIISALAVGVVYLVMMTLGLDAGARLAAASTLIVTAIPGSDALDLALSRGLNVPLGCLIAVAVGLVVFPHRASTALLADLRTDAEHGAALAAAAVRVYLGDPSGTNLGAHVGTDAAPDATPDAGHSQHPAEALTARCARLEASVAAHRSVLRDAAREPGSGHHLAALERLLRGVEALLDDARALVGLAVAGVGDRAPSLVSEELRRVALAIEEVVASARDDEVVANRSRRALGTALAGLDEGFAEVRRHRGTVEHSTDELARLLSVMRRVHGVGAALELTWPADDAPSNDTTVTGEV